MFSVQWIESDTTILFYCNEIRSFTPLLLLKNIVKWHRRRLVPEFIAVLAKMSTKRSFPLSENERFGLAFAKTGSINSQGSYLTRLFGPRSRLFNWKVPCQHRVDRVLSFFSSRPSWDSPTPSPAGECVPLPPLVPGGAHHLLERE